MYGKRQASGLTEFICSLGILAIWGQILLPDCWHPQPLVLHREQQTGLMACAFLQPPSASGLTLAAYKEVTVPVQ